ncbi:MAG: DUF4031 domain-containing protein [Bacillota bacterium]
MTVYVDQHNYPYKRMKLCHLWSEDQDELKRMAEELELKKSWKHNNHYDICLHKKKIALSLGAVEVTNKQMGKLLLEYRRKNKKSIPDKE